ncbi:hypothetical protein ACWEN6_13310 [Sphaerisporangium sp. NPDC004334]
MCRSRGDRAPGGRDVETTARPQARGGASVGGGPDELGGLQYDLGSHLVDQALRFLGPVTDVYPETDVRRAGARAFWALSHSRRSGTVAGLP